MAERKKLKASQIKPSQNFLEKNWLQHIQKCLDEDRAEDLPPTPLVAKVGDDLVALNGHELISVYDELQREVPVYVVSSATDVPREFAGTPSESVLKTKYEYAPKMYKTVQGQGIKTFTTLRLKGDVR